MAFSASAGRGLHSKQYWTVLSRIEDVSVLRSEPSRRRNSLVFSVDLFDLIDRFSAVLDSARSARRPSFSASYSITNVKALKTVLCRTALFS